ncbi:MAG: DnaD domain protein [Bacilli bacterium]|nr:DnaD domain protein [Bacilli bacterium]
MKVLANQDFLEVRLASLIADYDRDTLSNLYQPMIGFEALALYMTLWSEANNERVSPLCTHEQIFLRMRIPAGAYVEARKYLEATGLLKTFVSKGQDFKIYHYELYAPKSPRGFFDDALLYGMLIKSIGETNANRLKNIYLVEPKHDYGEEITTKFMEMFHPEFNDHAFLEAANGDSTVKGRNSGKIKGQFSYEQFFEFLSTISQIKDSAFNKTEMKEIERLATLNGVNEEETAKLVNQLYDADKKKGERIDFDKLAKTMQEKTDYKYRSKARNDQNEPNIVTGATDLAKKIRLMEMKSPKDYLSYLQGGTKPASADLKVINDLSKNYHLPNPVINAVVDYVLYKADNVLSRPYAEKVAVSLVRENILTAVDAMNYLKKVDKKSRNKKVNKTFIKVLETEKKDSDITNKDWEMDWDRILDEINGGNDGGKA